MSIHFSHKLNEDTELRLLEPNYAADLFALVEANREHFSRWLPWVPACREVEDRRRFLANCLQETAEHGNFIAGIWHSGALAGTVGINAVHGRDRTNSMFYWLGEEYQGKGLMTQACRAMISHAFTALQAHRVEIYAVTENQRSRRVAERLGFRHEGTRREAYQLNGQYLDLETYALLAHEWEPRQPIAFACPLTDDAELRLLLPHDAEELFAVTDRNRAYLRPWMSWMDTTTQVEHTREFIRNALQWQADGSSMQWGIWYRGQYAGGIGTVYIDYANRKTEIGYWVAEEHPGKGLVTMAARAMLEYLFTTLDMRRVEIHFRATNARSRAVAEWLGFVQEGVLRQVSLHDGQPADAVVTALLREEWEARR